MLQVEAVEKSFGDFKAVDGANLRVGKGEVVAVIGPNGAGKTTLFNLITGQLRPDRGRIIFKGGHQPATTLSDLPERDCPILSNSQCFPPADHL